MLSDTDSANGCWGGSVLPAASHLLTTSSGAGPSFLNSPDELVVGMQWYFGLLPLLRTASSSLWGPAQRKRADELACVEPSAGHKWASLAPGRVRAQEGRRQNKGLTGTANQDQG
jgi:hypothetical protein